MKNDDIGEICFSLRYVPSTGELTVVVLEMKQLPVLASGEYPGRSSTVDCYGRYRKGQVQSGPTCCLSVEMNMLSPFDTACRDNER